MSDALTTITHLIQSPPGQLAAGGILAGIVWKFFERVEAVLTDDTKLEIAVWLVSVRVAPSFESASALLRAIIGDSGSARRLLTTFALSSCTALIDTAKFDSRYYSRPVEPSDLMANFIPAFLVIMCWLAFAEHTVARKRKASDSLFCLLVILITVVARVFSSGVLTGLPVYQAITRFEIWVSAVAVCSIPILVLGMWIWLPFASALVLKAARRFDIGFDWFNRKFDIEKKPLQSIGLVAGALVAVVYWAASIIVRVWS
jgi:hypothetical protein